VGIVRPFACAPAQQAIELSELPVRTKALNPPSMPHGLFEWRWRLVNRPARRPWFRCRLAPCRRRSTAAGPSRRGCSCGWDRRGHGRRHFSGYGSLTDAVHAFETVRATLELGLAAVTQGRGDRQADLLGGRLGEIQLAEIIEPRAVDERQSIIVPGLRVNSGSSSNGLKVQLN
jgi:hypothetical protein